MPRFTSAGLPALASALALPCLAACSGGVLDPHGPVGAANRTILLDSLVIMLAIIVPVILGTLAVGWWFRAGNARANYRPDWEFSGRIELVVWSIPLMTILLLGGVAWIGSHRLDPAVPLEGGSGPPLEVQAVSLDWKWLFIYPEQQVASVDRLVVPAGRNLHFTLTSASVMNTFFIPQLGSMIYTMNGMATELNLRADHPGTYRGLSAHYSGEGFSDMHFEVRAVSVEEFAAWATAARSGRAPLDAGAYAGLVQPSVKKPPPTGYHPVDPKLFDKIVSQQLPPGPGPADTLGPHPGTDQ